MKKYAKIEKDKITKFKTIPDDDTVIIPKLLAHDYRIVEEQPVPQHDYITQILTDSFEIQRDRVLRVWAVTERPFNDAKRIKQDTVEKEVLDDIKVTFENENQKEKIDKAVLDKDVAITKIEAARNNAELRDIKYKETKEVK